ncbi:MAG: hypothetical protein ACYSUT_06155 [Planctomycetota bacterium]|jgi:hypothetical protein
MSWKKARIVFYILSFITGLFSFSEVQEDMVILSSVDGPFMELILLIFSILTVLFIYPAFLIVIGFQVKNPLCDKVWYLPEHSKNPLNLGQPLYFFHFAAYSGICTSIGILVSFIWNGLQAIGIGLFLLFAFLNVIWAIKFCIRVFNYKFQKESADEA